MVCYKKRSILLSVTAFIIYGCSPHGTTATTTMTTTTGALPDDAEVDARWAIAEVMAYIRELPVVKEKVAPIRYDEDQSLFVEVDISVAVVSVLSVDDAQQTVKTAGFLSLFWHDSSVMWNTSDYMGVQYLEMAGDSLWKPSVRFSNAIDDRDLLSKEGLVLQVFHNGWVYATVHFITETLCDMDLTSYPFDKQLCPLFMLSYSPTVTWYARIDAEPKTLAQSYAVGAEWDLKTTRVKTEQPPVGVEILTVAMEIERKTKFYTVCLILPMVVTSYMNTLVFLLPLQSGEKISFIVTIFVSTSVFVSFFVSVMPRGLDRIPDTMQLLIGVIVESILVLLGTIFVLRRFHQQAPDLNGETEVSRGNGSNVSDVSTSTTSISTSSCRKNSRTRKVQDSSVLDVQDASEMDARSGKTDQAAEERPRRFKPTAEHLDRVFFVLSFIGNTAFLAVLLFRAASYE